MKQLLIGDSILAKWQWNKFILNTVLKYNLIWLFKIEINLLIVKLKGYTKSKVFLIHVELYLIRIKDI